MRRSDLTSINGRAFSEPGDDVPEEIGRSLFLVTVAERQRPGKSFVGEALKASLRTLSLARSSLGARF